MTRKLYAVYDCLEDGGVIWTCDRPPLPGSVVHAFGYRQGRQFAVADAGDLLPLLLRLQKLGLALGSQTVPERSACARIIKWRRAPAFSETVVSLSQGPSAVWQKAPFQPRIHEKRMV